MGWFNAGTDQKTEAPDLFGCVELPEPAHCFGAAEVPYGAKQRDALIALLQDDKKQTMCWPALLKQTFTLPSAPSSSPLYGSPMLDNALGQVGMVAKVIALLREGHTSPTSDAAKKKKGAAGTESNGKKGSGKDSEQRDQTQFDNILPPEVPTSWVQCEACHKWRRVAWFVDSEQLPDEWRCTMNTWDPESASCDVAQDDYDPDAENTVNVEADVVALDESQFVVGKKFDVFCNRNKVFYEASVLKLKKNPKRPSDPTKIMFRYIGWGSRFDELIPVGSERIAPHNLHTNPASRNPREQEKWQGRKNLYADTSLIVNKKTGGTKVKDEDEEGAAGGKRKRAGAGAGKKGKKAARPAASASKAGGVKAEVTAAYCDDFEDLLEGHDSADEGSLAEGFPIAGLFDGSAGNEGTSGADDSQDVVMVE
jgi:hypothetical protein